MKNCDSNINTHIPGQTSSTYGEGAIAENVTYRFNGNGYRCDEYNEGAKFQLGVVGASNTLGYGIDVDSTAASRFRTYLAESMGYQSSDICLINMSIGGGSNDYCVRSILRQIPEYRPNLLIYDLAEIPRIEYIDEAEPRTLQLHVTDEDDEPTLAYIDLYTLELGAIGLLKNLLLVQEFLKGHGIRYLVSNGVCDLDYFSNFPACADLLEKLDHSKIYSHGFTRLRFDCAADGSHLGPRSHNGVAIGWLKHLAGQPDLERNMALRIGQRASELMVADSDWLEINAAQPDIESEPTLDVISLVNRGKITRRLTETLPQPMLDFFRKQIIRLPESISKRILKF